MEELVHQSERLAMDIQEDLDLPRIQRNLSQLLEAGNQLWKVVGSTASKDVTDVRASVLLGSKGYDFQKVSKNLDNLVTRGVKHYNALTSQPTQPLIKETDIQGFLKNERENAILKVIEEVKQSSKETVENQYWHTISRNWDKEKLALLNSFAGPHQREFTDLDRDDALSFNTNLDESIHKKQNISFASPKFADKSLRGVTSSRSVASNLDYQEVIYAKCIMNYVDSSVSSGLQPNIIENFIDIIRKETVELNIKELWETISNVISYCSPLKQELRFRQTLNFQVKFVTSSRRFLERKYLESAHITVYGNLDSIEVDSQSNYNLMKNFLSLRSPSWLSNITVLNSSINETTADPSDGTVDGHPVWSFIWHCLRAGLVETAIEVAQKCTNTSVSEEFVEVLRNYLESEHRRLPSKYENHLRLDYKRNVSKSNDIYKKSVYCVLASCDLTFSDATNKIEDFLWMRLCQIRYDHNNSDSDSISIHHSTPVKTSYPQPLIVANKLTLPQLQHIISEELGEAHFNAQESPLAYFKILFLTGLFEQAIDFLFRFQRFKCHAVHVAIALNEVGMLNVPDSYLSLPLLSKAAISTNGHCVHYNLNFVNILIRYTKSFSSTNATEAMYYYYLLKNIQTPDKNNLFITFVSELVRETGDYDHLLGYVNDFGRIGGVIDRFHLDIDEIVSKVAEDCESNGLYEAAVKLYDSVSSFGKVLEILIKLLSQVLPGRKSDNSDREKLEDLALRIANRYCEPEISAPRDVAGTFYLLLDLMAFFNHYHANQYCEALDIIKKLKLIPFNSNEVEIKAREFNKFPEEIRRNIADILLATMNMLYTTNKEQPSLDIKQKAKSLITFAGMIQYRMPSEAIARLIELEVLID